MNIRVENTGICRKTVHIELPADEVSKELETVLASYAKMARVPGFRPGRAPRGLIQRRYAREINQEVKERLIPRSFQQAIKQEKIETVAVLDVKEEELEEGRPFVFTVMLDVAPDFTLPSYTGIEIAGQKVEVSDGDVESTILRLRKDSGQYQDVTGRGVQKADMVQIDYEGTLDGQPLETVAPAASGLGKGKDFWMIADSENSFLPGFGEGLIGAKVGETREVAVEFPSDFPERSVAGKKAQYTAKVNMVRENIPAELNEAFLQSLAVGTVEDLRERVKRELTGMREASEHRRQLGEIVRYLLANTQLDVPESVVAQETKNEVYDLVRQSTHGGMSSDDIEQHKEELFDAATRTATDKVKLRYVLRRIAAAEKVESTRQELDRRIARMAMEYQMPENRFRADLEKRQVMGKIEEEVRLNKTLDMLLEKAKVTVG